MRTPKRKAVRCSNTLTAIKETNIKNKMNTTDFIAACARQASATSSFHSNPHVVEKAEAKRFATLRAQFALLGHTLHQSGPNDGLGPVSYLAERWGMARYLPTLNDADKFLAQIGGAA